MRFFGLNSIIFIAAFCVGFFVLENANANGSEIEERAAKQLLERLEGLEEDGGVVEDDGTEDSNENARKITIEQPSLGELYSLLKALFDLEAIGDFIDMKNRTDPNAAQLLLNIDTYMRGTDAVQIVEKFWAEEALQNVVHYMYLNGITDIYDKINAIHDKYGYKRVEIPGRSNHGEIKARYSNSNAFPPVNEKIEQEQKNRVILEDDPIPLALVHEFLRTLPLDDLRLWLEFAVKTDAGRALYDKLALVGVRDAYRRMRELEENKRLRLSLISNGFEPDTLKKIVEQVMTWENHSSVGLRIDNHAHSHKMKAKRAKEFQLY